jgi:predicted GNAT family acetyltransferase
MTTAPSAGSRTFEELGELFPAAEWDAFGAAGPEADRSAARDRDAAWLEDTLLIADFSAMPLRRLRTMANRLYRLLDVDFPPAGAVERYQTVTEELTLRAADTGDRTAGGNRQEVFNDNRFHSRFELYDDGVLAAYMKYVITAGRLFLLGGAEQPGFRGDGLGDVLTRHILLDAHKRRLEVVPPGGTAAMSPGGSPQDPVPAPTLPASPPSPAQP